jgi:hypothetical protein
MHHIALYQTLRTLLECQLVRLGCRLCGTFREHSSYIALSRNGCGNEISPMKREMGEEMRYR